MINTDKNYASKSLKEIKEAERLAKEALLKAQCNEIANTTHTEKQMKAWSMENKGIWFLPILDETGEKVEKLAIMRPINRAILSYATTKIQDEGLYAFLEACMRECWIAGDDCILEDDDYFLPAANKFNAIIEGKKAALLKR